MKPQAAVPPQHHDPIEDMPWHFVPLRCGQIATIPLGNASNNRSVFNLRA
jgi:hypothetical protein